MIWCRGTGNSHEISSSYRRERRDHREKEGLILSVLGGLCGEIWLFRNEDP
jgi:hypothetical protein